MPTRADLIRRAAAGDLAAAQALVEQHQPAVYRTALSLLDDPVQAEQASQAAFSQALNQLETLGSAADFSIWLTRIVVEVCRAALARQRLQQQVRRWTNSLLGRRPPAPPPGPEATWEEARLWACFVGLADRDRLALILRYFHGFSPAAIVLMLGGREVAFQRRMFKIRERLYAAWTEEGEPARQVHPRFRRLTQAQADRQITDRAAAELDRHQHECPACQRYAVGLRKLEGALAALFERRWANQPAPPAAFAGAVLQTHHQNHAIRRAFNWLGAAVMTAVIVGLVLLLPAVAPSAPIPVPATPTLVPTQAARPARAATATPVVLQSEPDLISEVYPGWLAYVTSNYQSEGGGLYRMRPDGSDVKGLAIDTLGVASPAWSPDGRQVAYLAIPQGSDTYQIYVAMAEGGYVRLVSRGDYPRERTPTATPTATATLTPSPTPTLLPGTPSPTPAAAARSRGQPPARAQPRYPLYSAPQWSADSQQILSTVMTSSSTTYLAVFTLYGAPATYLKVEHLDRSHLRWSPDGRQVAYLTQSPAAVWLWTPRSPFVAGRNPRSLEITASWDTPLGLDWSPDGQKLALLAGSSQGEARQALSIYDLRQGTLEKTIPLSSGVAQRGGLRDGALDWSPDGRYLAYLQPEGSGNFYNNRVQLQILALDGTEPRLLASPQRGVRDFTWSPDGHWLAFSSGTEIWAASLGRYEQQQGFLVRLAASAGAQLSWRKAN